MPTQEDLIFENSPTVLFAGNWYTNVPIILQVGATPLIEVVKSVDAGFTAQFSIYNRDGVKLAKVQGSRLFPTEDGDKANIKVIHPDRKTIFLLDDEEIIVMERTEAAALRTEAELYTPNGNFVKAHESLKQLDSNNDALRINGNTIQGNHIMNSAVGIQVGDPNSRA